MPKKSAPSSCDWRAPAERQAQTGAPRARVLRHKAPMRWGGVRVERYKDGGDHFRDVSRMSLVAGLKGERAGFHLRYFEVGPGGHTSLERHEHEHVVIVVRGEGVCRIGRRRYSVGHLDTIYIPPGAVHRLENPSGEEPFGFFCIVDAERDRPEVLEG